MEHVEVKVLYKFVEGTHFFVSDDEQSAGLCVADDEIEIAFNAVEVQLEKLFKLNHGMNMKFEPSIDAMTFAAWVKSQTDHASSQPTPGVAGQAQWHKAAHELIAA